MRRLQLPGSTFEFSAVRSEAVKCVQRESKAYFGEPGQSKRREQVNELNKKCGSFEL